MDDTDGDSLLHVSDSESSERWELLVGLDAHWLVWNQLNDGGFSVLDELWTFLDDLTGSLVDLLDQLVEPTGDVSGVAVQHWRVSGGDLVWMVHDDDLGGEVLDSSGWVVVSVRSDKSSLDVLDSDVSNVESNVVTWDGLDQLFVVHLDLLALGGVSRWGEVDHHTGLEDTGLDSADWDGSDSGDLEDVVDWESQCEVGWSLWSLHGVEGSDEGVTLVPLELWRLLDQVLTSPSGNWDEWDLLWLVSSVLEEVLGFLLDFAESLLGVVGGFVVHLVDGDDHLLDTQSLGEESVLSGLSFLGDTGFELTSLGGDDQHGAIGLGSSGDHVLDEISVTWSIDDGVVVGLGLELGEGDVDSDTSISLGLEVVKGPGESERSLTDQVGLLSELVKGSLVDTTAKVDQVTGSGGLSGIDVSDDDEVNVWLVGVLWHCLFFF